MSRDKHNATVDDVYRIVEDYIKPDDKFTETIRKIPSGDYGKLVEQFRERIKRKNPSLNLEPLSYIFYKRVVMEIRKIIVKDEYAKTEKVQKDLSHYKPSKSKPRQPPKHWTAQEKFFIREHLKRGKFFGEAKRKEVREKFKQVFGDYRSDDSFNSEYQRIREKIMEKKR